MRNLTTKYRSGLSLIEVVVSSMLVGTVVVGSISLLSASVRTHRVSSELAKGPALANALLAEIMSMPYYDPETGSGDNNTDAGELTVTRQDFDDVGDYDDWSTSTVQNKQGNALSEYSGWSRSAQVAWGNQLSGDVWWLWDTGAKRILVTVTSPSGVVTTRYGWRAKDGSLEQAPITDKTVVTQVTPSLTIGLSATSTHGTTNLLNHVEDPN